MDIHCQGKPTEKIPLTAARNYRYLGCIAAFLLAIHIQQVILA